MSHIAIGNLIPKRVLTSRDTVKAVAPEIVDAAAEGSGEITFDFSGVEAAGPSVLEQLLSTVAHLSGGRDILFLNMPGDSLKVEMVARVHNRSVVEDERGGWRLTAA